MPFTVLGFWHNLSQTINYNTNLKGSLNPIIGTLSFTCHILYNIFNIGNIQISYLFICLPPGDVFGGIP